MSGPRVGDKAPDFTLPAQDGRTVSLHEFAGTKNVVLYFYPKDFTMGCTQETKAFGESYEGLLEMGAEVIGISSDSAESHNGFAKECGARFPLLADAGGKVRAEYGAKSMGLIPDRVTFVIDKKGVVRHKFSSQLKPRQHIAEAIEALKAIRD
ncbi:MAG: peroxiredoxin [Nitrososphaerota archaeon]|nr:peroxiredoxin [Nitrososphaerota archaeon]MDG6945848.1 peroxiredoxin [Nitrososphaerota archaeon]MDG6949402.1 peroxiredoxin [Nitrososphaerota archaeon]